MTKPAPATETIWLPYPRSANNLYGTRKDGKGRYRTAKYKAWAKHAGQVLMIQRPHKFRERVTIEAIATPPAVVRKRDASNLIKAVEDLLKDHTVIVDDSEQYVKRSAVTWSDEPGKPGIVVRIEAVGT